MPEFEHLRDLLILFGLGAVAVTACHRARIPAVAGFLITGIVSGPHGLGLIPQAEVDFLAEIGVILLLFTVGIEFSLRQLAHVRTFLLVGGGLQVGLTIGTVLLLAQLLGWPLPVAAFIGMLIALSSTAIVIRLLADHGEVDTPHGRAALGICIFQDICLVPMLLLVPFLAAREGGAFPILWIVLKALLIVSAFLVSARYVVPRLLHLVVQTRNREAFLLSVIFLCLGTAWITAAAGLSLALGAFIAGLVISESEYSHQALSEVLPFREVFNSIFFISMGMLLDMRTVLFSPASVLGGIVFVIGLKALATAGATFAVERSLRVAVITGLLMAQIGEFSFVLSKAGLAAGLLDQRLNQLFLAVAVGTMAATPWLHKFGSWLSIRVEDVAVRQRAAARLDQASGHQDLRDHVIVIGYGVNGRNLAHVLQHVSIPFVVIDLSPASFQRLRQDAVRFIYGDATHPDILVRAGVRMARVVVIAISDAAATRRASDLVRRLNPGVHLIVRTRYIREVEPLLAAGAQDVVPEEFETSIEIFSRVLARYLVPRDVIERCMWEARLDAYDMFRSTYTDGEPHRPAGSLRPFLSELSLGVYRVRAGSPIVGKSLQESDIRRKAGVSVVAIQRPRGEVTVNPGSEVVIEAEDSILLLGRPEHLSAAAALFGPQGEASISN